MAHYTVTMLPHFVRKLDRGGFRHVQHFPPNMDPPQKRGPHKRTWAKNNHVITKYSVNVR